MSLTIGVRVPGKILLAGEYAVLRGGRALAMTTSHAMTICLANDEGRGMHVTSPLWPDGEGYRLDFAGDSDDDDGDGDDDDVFLERTEEPLLRTVRMAARETGVRQGHIDVDAALNPSHGTGSSSGFRLGVRVALAAWRQRAAGLPSSSLADLDPVTLATAAWRDQVGWQKRASGYDIITQCLGGLVEMQQKTTVDDRWLPVAERLDRVDWKRVNEHFHIFVGSVGAPTTTTILGAELAMGSADWQAFDSASEELVAAFKRALQDKTLEDGIWHLLVGKVRAHRTLTALWPTYPRTLFDRLALIPGFDETWTAKTTGAGGQDAILVCARAVELGAIAVVLADMGWVKADFHFADQPTYIVRPRHDRVRGYGEREHVEPAN